MIDWRAIDTVLLDMDGTLLDLHFDNHFWLTHLPARYAEHYGLDADQTASKLGPVFRDKRGSLEWYCLEFWSRHLGMNIRALKEEIQHLIAERPHALHFLDALGSASKKRILITNAHPQSLDLKLSLTGIGKGLDEIISSHQLGYPKEEQAFWAALRERTPFDPARTLFIDDSLSVLKSAERYGIAHLFAITHPDSKGEAVDTGHFPAIRHFDDVLPLPASHTGGPSG